MTRDEALEDRSRLLGMFDSCADLEPFNAQGALVPKSFVSMLKAIRLMPGDAAGQGMDRLDGYLHFLKDNGHWHQGTDVFDLLHALVLMRVPGRSHRKTPHECPEELAMPQRWSIALVQWAAYLLGEMLEGKFIPDCGESIALPMPGPMGPVLLAPGLHPLPLSVFTNILTAMHAAYLCESEADERVWNKDEDEDENTGESWEDDGGLYPTHLGMALMQDDHSRNDEAVRSLLTAYLRNLILALLIPELGMTGLRRADRFFAVLIGVATEESAPKAQGETNFLVLGEDIKDQLAKRFDGICAPLLNCLQSGVLEYRDGVLVAQPVVHQAINDLREEYAQEPRILSRQRTGTPTKCVVRERRSPA